MKIKSVTFGRTKSVHYQAQRADVTIELSENDTFDSVLEKAKALVDMALGDGPTPEQVKAAREVLATAEAMTKATGS
jgi:hypothetical protein